MHLWRDINSLIKFVALRRRVQRLEPDLRRVATNFELIYNNNNSEAVISYYMDSNNLQRSSKLSKANKSLDVHSADRISELPDELLENILSRLTIIEAVATSTLSRRWKHLWAYTTGCLDFDFGSAALIAMKETRVFTTLETERVRYRHRVNKFIDSHKGLTIDAFRIKFDLQSSAATDINSWIKFALRKRVGRLELDLSRADRYRKDRWLDLYAFPLLESLDIEKPNLSWLKSLNFNFVDMTRETVEYLLSNCPILEYVRILNSPNLVGIRVVATLPKLKHLRIARCHSFEFLEISSAPNLTSLSYSGPEQTRHFRDIPNLVDVSLGGAYCKNMIQKFHELRLPLSQIWKLKLSTRSLVYRRFNKFPKLEGVTQLELELTTFSDDFDSYLDCAYAIEACPNLCRLSVKLYWWFWKPVLPKAVEQAKGRINKRLKVVELLGFRGSTIDVELATYIFCTAPFLENITVDTVKSNYIFGNAADSFSDVDQNPHARNVALQLASKFSPAAQLLIR